MGVVDSCFKISFAVGRSSGLGDQHLKIIFVMSGGQSLGMVSR